MSWLSERTAPAKSPCARNSWARRISPSSVLGCLFDHRGIRPIGGIRGRGGFGRLGAVWPPIPRLAQPVVAKAAAMSTAAELE